MSSRRAIVEDLYATCDDARTHAEKIAASPFAPATADHRAALVLAVNRHLGIAEGLWTSANRALLHDHRKLAQLLRALELALDAPDARVAVAARRLGQFIAEHATRERKYV